MTDTVQQSFCERCGTRYTVAEPQESGAEGGRSKRGLFGRREREASKGSKDSTTPSSGEPLTGTFHFCLECRQYTCPNCWNAEAGACLGCRAPGQAAGVPDFVAPAPKPGGSGKSLFASAATASTSKAPTAGEGGAAADGPAVELDEWGRPRVPRATEPEPEAAETPGTKTPEIDPWRGVVFTEDEATAPTRAEALPETPEGAIDFRADERASSPASEWPVSDRAAEEPGSTGLDDAPRSEPGGPQDAAVEAEPEAVVDEPVPPDDRFDGDYEDGHVAAANRLQELTSGVDASSWARATSAAAADRAARDAAARDAETAGDDAVTDRKGDPPEAEPESTPPVAESTVGPDQPSPESPDAVAPAVPDVPTSAEAHSVSSTEPATVPDVVAEPVAAPPEVVVEPAAPAPAESPEPAVAVPTEPPTPEEPVAVEPPTIEPPAAAPEPGPPAAAPEPGPPAAAPEPAPPAPVEPPTSEPPAPETATSSTPLFAFGEPEPAESAPSSGAPSEESATDAVAEPPEPPPPGPPAEQAPVEPSPTLTPAPPGIDVWSTPPEPGPFAQPYAAQPFSPPPSPTAAPPSSAATAPAPQPRASTPPPPDTSSTPVAPPPPSGEFIPPPSPPMRTPVSPAPRPGTRTCPNCSLPLSAKARFCRRCGAPQS